MKNKFFSNLALGVIGIALMALCTVLGVYDFATIQGIQIAATVGVVPVSDLQFFKDIGGTWTAYGCAQSATMERSREMQETTCKGSGANQEVTPGKKQGTLNMTNFMAFDHANGFDDQLDALEDGDKFKVRFTTDETGDTYREMDVYVESCSLNSDGVTGPSSWSSTMRITGGITKGVNA